MGSNCCKRRISDYTTDRCGRCRAHAGNANASKKCEECNAKYLCETYVEERRFCCCSPCCDGCEEVCCCVCCLCLIKRTIWEHIVDIPPLKASKATQASPPSPLLGTTRKLTAVEKRIFKADGEECWITCFDVLPNGMFVIADRRRRGGWLYIFSRENKMLCNLYAASSETSVLDLAALTNHSFAYIDMFNPRILHFVQIGERYRHMERKEQRTMDLYCHRIYCFDNKIFLACIQPTASTVLLLDLHGDEISRIQCPNFRINSLTYHRDVKTDYVYMTDIEQGIRCYEKKNGHFIAVHSDYRDIDVQWYYGITSDRLGNVFVCTQDELGPEVYKLELAEHDPLDVSDMKLHLTKADGLEFPTTIRYNHNLDKFIVGSFGISFEKPIFPVNPGSGNYNFQTKRGQHDGEGSDRQKHAQTNTSCRCTTLGIYNMEKFNDTHTVRETVKPSKVVFDIDRKPIKLIAEGKMSFKLNDRECAVSGYDILPRGETDTLPGEKIVVADAEQKLICIFGQSPVPRNILHCKMRLKSNLHLDDDINVLDVAAITDRRLVFVADNKKAIYFVVAGKRFRHMEIEKVESTRGNGRRVCYFQNKMYIVSMNDTKSESFIEIFSLNERDLKLLPLRIIDCGEFHFVTSIAASASYIFVSSVAGGIRVYDHTGNLINRYRDIDVQWYYGIVKDKYDNWFVCTQDEIGPEIYEIKVDDKGKLVRGLFLRITTKEGLEPPLTLCYHPRLDLLMVGSNHNDKQEKGLGIFRKNEPSRDPYLVEKEARERFALRDAFWNTRDCDLYKIEYL